MSGIKIDNFSTSDVNLTAIMATAQAMRQGHFKLSLTEMDTTTIPKIAAGSIVDLNGSLVYFDADEVIGGTPVDGVTYIKLIYSGGVVTTEWTATAPSFNSSKNGWYGVSTNSGHRYISKMIKSTASYTGKILYDTSNIPYIYETLVDNYYGNWNLSETKTVVLTFTNNIYGIINIDIKTTALSVAHTTSIVILNNTITIQMLSESANTASGYYNITCTAACL